MLMPLFGARISASREAHWDSEKGIQRRNFREWLQGK
jgi:hypothetical protein